MGTQETHLQLLTPFVNHHVYDLQTQDNVISGVPQSLQQQAIHRHHTRARARTSGSLMSLLIRNRFASTRRRLCFVVSSFTWNCSMRKGMQRQTCNAGSCQPFCLGRQRRLAACERPPGLHPPRDRSGDLSSCRVSPTSRPDAQHCEAGLSVSSYRQPTNVTTQEHEPPGPAGLFARIRVRITAPVMHTPILSQPLGRMYSWAFGAVALVQ